MSAAREVAERALAIAKGAAPGAEVVVSTRQRRAQNTRFARNELTTQGDYAETEVQVRVTVGRRHASATANQTDDASLRALAERAATMARLAPEDPEHLAALGPQTYPSPAAAWDDATADVPAAARARRASECVALAEADKLHLAGFEQSAATTRALVASTGLLAEHRATDTSFTCTARTTDGAGSGWAGRASHRASDLDVAALARVAADKAKRSAGARALEPGRYTVILEPAAVAEMLAFLVPAMDARPADEGRSFFAGKLGEKLFADLVTLASDPTSPDAPGAPFDHEGVPLEPVRWIDRGKVENLAYTRYWAQKKAKRATGRHGTFHLNGGSAASTDELLAGVERGLLVTRFWYTRMLDPQAVLLTGLTRDGLFLVENGRVTAPVANFRYNESPVTVLRNTDALTRATARVPGVAGGIWRVPALRTRDFTMASPSAAV